MKLVISLFLLTPLWASFFSSDKEKEVDVSSIVIADEDTPVDFEQPKIEVDEKNAEDWQKPDYSLSLGSMGYDKKTFAVPDGLKKQVDFWKDIYTKYSSWQGVLHDSEHIDHIYAEIDFTPIMKNNDLSAYQKRKAKRKMVTDKKKEIVAIMYKLQKTKDITGLSPEELRIWLMYDDVSEKDKFIKAAKKGRLRFQLGQKDYFLQGIYYSGRYLREMTEIFKSYNLPIELTRMPFVESSFNYRAKSKVGASGIWQFMPSTGKQYMKVNRIADYRNHPIRASVSAAKKLRYIYNKTEAWPLAITGYNYGPSGIARLSRKLKTKDLVEIIDREKSGRFGFASSNFYASFLAAIQVEAEADKYFNKPKWMPEMRAKEYKLSKSIRYNSLQQLFKEEGYDFDLYNPQFTKRTKKYNWLVPSGYRVYIPQAKAENMWASIVKLKSAKLAKRGSEGATYQVRRGDTLSHIADRFGVRVRDIMEWNDLASSRIYAGQTLKIPNL
tara:strand:+ start:320 stop:1810 length:1491 start_codon:yes stop_codon:yes gene_type:complete